ncbi:MAG: transcriptional regulator [Lachnospiraceae bacterium]|jgi:uncharacterized protein YjaZ|nr:transcriptional regulator [Lachnospiraceae bacterium]MDY6286231.1 transcriptional regulator [Lachnospiraceae bacterium]
MEDKNKTQLLKESILSQYKSVRQFAAEMGIPYSTLVTALDRGIDGMAYSTVISICERLAINPVNFAPMSDGDRLSEQITTRQVMGLYHKLNQEGRRKALDYMDDLSMADKYTA